MPRLSFSCFVICVSCFALAACDSASLNQSQANPFVVLAAQFAEGSVGSAATQPHPNTIPTPSYQPNPLSASPRHPVASSQHSPLTAANPPANLSTPW